MRGVSDYQSVELHSLEFQLLTIIIFHGVILLKGKTQLNRLVIFYLKSQFEIEAKKNF